MNSNPSNRAKKLNVFYKSWKDKALIYGEVLA
jgi:hypothetical protein